MMYKSLGCSLCGQQAPKRLREHGTFNERMSWIREHREKYHLAAFKRSIKKAVASRRK